MPDAVLSLDALYGQTRPLIVERQGKRVPLLRPEAMGPLQYLQFERLQTQIGQLSAGDVTTEADAALLDEIVTAELRIIGPELAEAGLAFPARLAIVQFYVRELARERAQKGADGGDPKAPTGVNSTPG
jgi:hypothetical protein